MLSYYILTANFACFLHYVRMEWSHACDLTHSVAFEMRIRHNRKQHSLPAILKIVNTKLLHYAQYLNMPSRTLQYNYHFYATCIWQSLEQCSLFTLKSIKFNFYVLKISNTIFIKKIKIPTPWRFYNKYPQTLAAIFNSTKLSKPNTHKFNNVCIYVRILAQCCI